MSAEAAPDAPALPPEVEAALTPEVKQALAVFLRREVVGIPADPLRDKFTSGHIDRLLEIERTERRHEFLGSLGDKLFVLVLALLCFGFLVFLIVWLSASDRELLKDLLQIFLPFLGGVGCGVGLDEGARRLFKRD